MKPTKEQIDAARGIACNPQAFERDELIGALTILGSAIHTLSAELEAERAAHAETRAMLDRLPTRNQVLLAERESWQRATGCPSPEAFAARKGEPAACRETFGHKRCDRPAGHAPPCNCVASTEPTDEQLERLSNAYTSTLKTPAGRAYMLRDMPPHVQDEVRAGVRAVLRSLPAPTLPSEEEIAALAEHLASYDGVTFTRNILPSIRAKYAERARAVVNLMRRGAPPSPAASESDRAPDTLPWALRICRTKLLPWLEDLDQPLGDAPAALRVVLSAMPPAPPSDEQLAEEAARYAARETSEPYIAEVDIPIALNVISAEHHPYGTWHLLVRGFAAGRREGRR